MARIVDHLSLEALEARYRAARDAREARHTQAIWLLAQGRTFLEVAEVLAFARRTVERRQGGGLDGAASRSAEGEGFPFSLEAWSTAPPEPDKAWPAGGAGH